MKSSLLYILFLLSLSLVSCVKEIPFDFVGNKKTMVIEALLNNVDSFSVVKISESNNLTGDSIYAKISGAQIQLKDLTAKKSAVFSEISPGNYKSAYFKGEEGHEYQMIVQIGNQTYTASCEMPLPILLDSLEFLDMSLFGGQGYHTLIDFQDSKGFKNYYRFIQKVNGVEDKYFYVFDDKFMDGKYQNLELYKNGQIKLNDLVEVEMMCIDPSVFSYFYQLSNLDAASGQKSIAPANPNSNFSGGVLGYFSAYTSQTKKAIVQ
jgi:hypothetical protein